MAIRLTTPVKKIQRDAHYLEPLKMASLVPREYVRQQLKSMGITEISEEELESYTTDFSRLIQQHIQYDSSSSNDLSSLSSTPHPHLTPTTPSTLSSAEQTPTNTHPPPPTPGSAVFKTFPGDKENRVQLLSPSPAPSLSSVMFSPNKNVASVSGKDSKVNDMGGVRIGVKRKVLRKCNGETRVFDESLSGSVPTSPLDDRTVPRQLSHSSLASVSSSEASLREPEQSWERPHSCKSFIRPMLVHPHLRGLKKCDPVQRYHEFHKLWEAQKPPGEKNRSRLRWHIREQLLQQDVPYFEPSRRAPKGNEFVAPTDKKRSTLRWEVRHQLAHP